MKTDNRKGWQELENYFKDVRYTTYRRDPIDYVPAEPMQNCWDLPLSMWNPDLLRLLINMNKRIEVLEDELKEVKKQCRTAR